LYLVFLKPVAVLSHVLEEFVFLRKYVNTDSNRHSHFGGLLAEQKMLNDMLNTVGCQNHDLSPKTRKDNRRKLDS
jgi:hypothetical protein